MSNYKLKYSGEKIDEILTKADSMSEVVTATGETAGKVKLSDATDSESDASAGIAATPKAVKAAFDAASAAGEAAGDLSTKVEKNTTAISENATAIGKLEKDIDNLSSSKISKFYASSQGNTNLPDSDNGKIIDLKLYGKGSQKQYAGRNLWSGENLESYWMGDGETVNGDCVSSDFIPVDGAKTIYAGFSYDWAVGYTCYDSNKNRIDGSTLQINLTTSGAEKAYEIRASANKTPENTAYIKLMYSKHEQKPYVSVAEGAYEPYVGGIPSPNPEYPQEIKSVAKPVVKVTSQNYLEYKDAGGGVTAPVTLAKGDHYLTRFFLTSSTEVNNTVEYFSDGTWKSFSSVGSFENGKIVVSESTFGWYAEHMKIACTENIAIRVGISRDSVIALNDYGYLDKYAEYQAPQTVTLPYTLNAIPVTSGNVTIDGQQYIADYVDVERGKLVRCVERKRLFDLNVQRWGGLTETRADFQVDIEKYDSGTYKYRSIPCIMSSLTNSSATSGFPSFDYGTTGDSGWSGYAKLGIYVSKDYDTVDKLKSYLGEDTEILYQSKDPTETDLTADEIAAFKALVSYYPVTNVSTTSEQLDGYTLFNYPISIANGWNYVKKQIGDTRDYLYDIDLVTAEAYVNSAYATALAEMEI